MLVRFGVAAVKLNIHRRTLLEFLISLSRCLMLTRAVKAHFHVVTYGMRIAKLAPRTVIKDTDVITEGS